MNTNFIIGVCGHARSGKDTFCEHAKSILSKKKIGAARAAFADELKKDLDDLCRHKIGISAFTQDSKEKDIIRPLGPQHAHASVLHCSQSDRLYRH